MVGIALVCLIILRKDISLQLNLQSPVRPLQQEQTQLNDLKEGQAEWTAQQETSSDVPPSKISKELTQHNEKKKEKAPKTQKPVQASQFSNLGFILNPTYAQRNNISPQIVAEKNRICKQYIQRFGPVAVKEMKKYGIPASITLAQGLLESNAGQSKLATLNNNHFGIKCFSQKCQAGHCSNHSDDSHKDFFRKYHSAWESYRAHSLFLQRARYQHLLELPQSDYKAWAKGLSEAGYATDPKYASKLICIIDALNLHRFDGQ